MGMSFLYAEKEVIVKGEASPDHKGADYLIWLRTEDLAFSFSLNFRLVNATNY